MENLKRTRYYCKFLLLHPEKVKNNFLPWKRNYVTSMTWPVWEHIFEVSLLDKVMSRNIGSFHASFHNVSI